jgi:ABC-2 type transport system permease protein
MALRPGLWLVIRRELRWIRRRPVILSLTLLFPLLLTSLLVLIFGFGVPTEFPLAVVDRDGSDLSRALLRRVDATAEVRIIREVQDLAAGRQLILSGEAHGLLLIPEQLERDTLHGRRPGVVLFYDNQFMLIGSLVWRGVANAVAASAAGLRVALRASHGQSTDLARAALAPIPVQQHPLFNPSLDYVQFLLAAIIPALLQIIIATTSAYSFSLEMHHGRAAILRRLGGGRLRALVGKLLPHTLIFLIVLALAYAVLFGPLGVPLRGDIGVLLAACVLFVLACQLLGGFMAIATADLVKALSTVALCVAPAFGFMGISFPRIGMNGFAQVWSALLPGTWFLQVQVDQTLRGAPPRYSLPPLACLALIVAILGALTLWMARRRLAVSLPPPDASP